MKRRLKNMKSGKSTRIVPIIVMGILFALATNALAQKSPFDWACIRLDYARDEKMEQLDRFCKRMDKLARKAAGDSTILEFFSINRKYAEAVMTDNVPNELKVNIEKLRDNFNRYYIENYFAFYDILFVNMEGQVFYSIRKESDLQKNMFQDPKSDCNLSRRLREKPTKRCFVDFLYYTPSTDAAAFFVEPVREDGKLTGWLILQVGINKLNSLFTSTDYLGQTGETFLVNQEGYMLTESYFDGSSTILKRHLSDKNIQAKFKEEKGHRTITDYRGARALSSFQTFDFMDTKWLVVAKIDKDEVRTQHFSRHRKFYLDQLGKHIQTMSLAQSGKTPEMSERLTIRVDMDEFLKSEKGAKLETYGISTCTGILVSYPAKFAYLAHASNRDRIYGGTETDLLGQMTKKIETFDIYPCEKGQLVFVIVANQTKSILSTVEYLVDNGFLLSQIYIAYNSYADTASMEYDYTNHHLAVRWSQKIKPDQKVTYSLEDAVQVSRVIQKMLDESE